MRQVSGKRAISPAEQVHRRHRVGVAAESPAPAAGKSGKAPSARTSVRKRLSQEDEKLLAQIMAQEQDFIDSPAFYEKAADNKIYDEAPDIAKPDTSWYHPVMDDLSASRSRTVKSA